MAPYLGNQQNYSAYLLCFVGLILIASEYKWNCESEKTAFELAQLRQIEKVAYKSEINTVDLEKNNKVMDTTVISKEQVSVEVKSSNPFDIPDDF